MAAPHSVDSCIADPCIADPCIADSRIGDPHVIDPPAATADGSARHDSERLALDLYVYYQVGEAQAADLAARVRAMQADLAACHGVTGHLKRRPQAAHGRQTWMEVYLAVSGDFAAALAAAAAAADIGALIHGERHTETFMDLFPCA